METLHQHPTIYLKELFKFVYPGKVEILQGFLSDFVSTYKVLEIIGLSEEDIIKDVGQYEILKGVPANFSQN